MFYVFFLHGVSISFISFVFNYSGVDALQQTYLKRSSVGKSEKRLRHDSGASTDDAMSIASNDSEASFCTLPSEKRDLPQPKLKVRLKER